MHLSEVFTLIFKREKKNGKKGISQTIVLNLKLVFTKDLNIEEIEAHDCHSES